jgi:hypothetical protein
MEATLALSHAKPKPTNQSSSMGSVQHQPQYDAIIVGSVFGWSTCAEIQGDWIAQTLTYLRDHSLQELEPTPEAEQAWRALVNGIGDAPPCCCRPSRSTWAPTSPESPRNAQLFGRTDRLHQANHRCSSSGVSGIPTNLGSSLLPGPDSKTAAVINVQRNYHPIYSSVVDSTE